MHLDDDAELYALGLLDAGERERADAHVATCDACARRVARAESLVARLAILPRPEAEAAPVPERGRLRYLGAAVALAAALFVGFAFGRTTAPRSFDDVVRAQIVHSHFRHVALVPRGAISFSAKALYGNSGEWVWIVIDRPDCRCRFQGYRGGQPAIAGEPVAQGSSAAYFARSPEPLTRVMLVSIDDGRTLAEATLIY